MTDEQRYRQAITFSLLLQNKKEKIYVLRKCILQDKTESGYLGVPLSRKAKNKQKLYFYNN